MIWSYIAAEDINGIVLGDLDRETLKELGIKSVGRQLELLKQIKSLFRKKRLFIFFQLFHNNFLGLTNLH